MAVRFDAATDQLALADAPASSAPFTACGWVRNVELVGFGTIMRLRAAGTVASFTASSGGSNGPQLATTGGTAGPIVGSGDGSLPADAWRRVAFVIAGSGTDNCTVYWGDDDPATDLLSAVGSVAVGSPTALSIGGRGGGDTTERWGGDLAYPRAWDAVLTATELKAELASTEAVVTDGLWADWPLEVHTDLTDHSGNGRHLTAGSTSTTTVDGPPLVADFELPLDPAAETDTAQLFGATKTQALTPATETATARPLGATKTRAITAAVATEAAQPLGRHKALALGTALETDAASVVGATKTRTLGAATETDQAMPFALPVSPLVGGVDVQIKAIMSKVISVVQGLGLLETVNGGQAMHMPGAGLRASVWPGRITSPPGSSGLSKVSIVLPVMIRIFGPARAIQVDEIEDEMLDVIDKLADAYVGKFTLDGLVRAIDIHGRFGQPMTIEPGYLDIQDGTCRVETMTLPLIINNAWEEVA